RVVAHIADSRDEKLSQNVPPPQGARTILTGSGRVKERRFAGKRLNPLINGALPRGRRAAAPALSYMLTDGRRRAPMLRSWPRLGHRRGVAWTLLGAASRESIMIRFAMRLVVPAVLALTVAGALPAPGAQAQTAGTEDNRYQFNRVEDGY